ncbi:gamma-glutamyltransferase [Desmospora profundinema]|uniref:Glutathione hydrolase proenzyme n=1 Tax=Desmospora profundinema TaxID=1571184 RepID=A0ABU1INQ1_9BACL|nr:gamma-glutamyltransferase [Desmospora profundinema]MDR6226397.1 gamma-glutamyltranspeptidase/glutathione hydrolase [Desmospora profundinema]
MTTRTLNILLSIIVIVGMSGVYLYEAFGKSPDTNSDSLSISGPERNYSVATAHPMATEVGMRVLSQGGNAVDAAVAISYALGVVEPHGSGIGGGGTLLVRPQNQEPVVYDYREIASYSGMMSPLGIGVPGFVKGMEAIHQDFGSMDMRELIEPSIELATEGVELTSIDESRIERAAFRMPMTEVEHMYPEGQGLKRGDILVQDELAQTLERIQMEGSSAFYEGTLAQEIVSKVPQITLDDLRRYEVIKKEPVKGEFAGYDVYGPPAPSGGIMMIQTLQMAEALQVEATKEKMADFVHLTGEIYKRSYRDRLRKIGDPAFVDVPEQKMISKEYTQKLASDIKMDKLSEDYREKLDSEADIEDHDNTTHFVVIDRDGMMVSGTNTVSGYFGSGVYVKGFFMNNQLKNFSLNPELPNRPEPGKRPYSYTSPTILVKDGEAVIGIGSAGGRRIPAMVAQVLIRHLKYEKPLAEAMESPRSYVEVEDDTVAMERAFPEEVRLELEHRGYPQTATTSSLYFGGIQTLRLNLDTGEIEGSADPRRDGTWRVER